MRSWWMLLRLKRCSRRLWLAALLGLGLGLGASVTAAAAIEVRVGGYAFPPFVDLGAGEQPYGLALDLLSILNRQQQQYRFSFVLTSPNRRFQDFAAGRFDMMLFEDLRWGWANQMMVASRPFLRDGDVFVTRQSPERDQQYFATLTGKQIFAVRGYHYAFAGYVADPDELKARFGVELLDPRSNSLERGLQQVASGQPDLLITTATFLRHYFVHKPTMREQLLLAEKWDSEYQHGALVHRQHAFSAAQFDGLMEQLRANGELQAVLARYGMSDLLITPP